MYNKIRVSTLAWRSWGKAQRRSQCKLQLGWSRNRLFHECNLQAHCFTILPST